MRLSRKMAISLRLVSALASSLAAITVTVSCGGDPEDGDSPKGFFTSKVYPQLEGPCASCHATGKRGAPIFLAGNADGSYNAIRGIPGFIAPPTQSPLVQKGLHSGPALTELQETVVTAWLQKEPEGGKGDNSKPTNLRAAFKAFGACMDYQEWTALGLDKIPESVSSLGACTSCHNTGAASIWLSDNPAQTFEKLSQFPAVQRLVTGNVDEKGHFQRIVDAERLIVKGKERPRNGNHHPSFELGAGINGVIPAEMQQNLRTFVSSTINKMYRANGCAAVVRPDGGLDGAAD